jgi:hypothetical protein
MIAELVTIKLPPGMTRADVLAAAHHTVPGWAANTALLRKHFLLDEPGTHTYGFYLWRSREAAQAAHGEAFVARVRERFACEPTFEYFDVLLNLDNLDGSVVEDLAELERTGTTG